jgi:ABC-2 type transport system ATP-binding protein
MPAALSLQDVRVRFGKVSALDGVSLDVARGEIVGLVGPNGSGKSTTLAVSAGILDPASGIVTVEGIRREHDPYGFAGRVGLVPQDCALYDELSAADNLAFFGQLYGIGGRDLRRRVARVLSRVRMTDRARHRVGTLSGGMKQRINLAAALLHDPPVLLLDEPTAALDPAARDALFADLFRLRDDGHAVLISTHHLDEAELGCDRVAVLDRGRLVAVGKPRDLFRRRGSERAVLYGQLRSALPKFLERSLRKRLGPTVEFDVTGRRLRLAAADSESLGRALSLVLAEGVDVDSFRTPPGTLERVLHPRTKQLI